MQDANPATRWATVAGLDTTWDASQSYSSTYLGPDDKIYIGNWGTLAPEVSVFNAPNGKGAASGFCPKCLRFPAFLVNGQLANGVGTPPNITNYSLGATVPPCPLLGIEDEAALQLQPANLFKLYPSPTTGALNIEYTGGGIVEIADMLGRVQRNIVLSEGKRRLSVDVGNLTPGVYTYRRTESGRAAQTGKLVVMQ